MGVDSYNAKLSTKICFSLQKPHANKSNRELEKNLDNNKIVGTVFMDLSKVFDFIPHELLYSQNAGLWLR